MKTVPDSLTARAPSSHRCRRPRVLGISPRQLRAKRAARFLWASTMKGLHEKGYRRRVPLRRSNGVALRVRARRGTSSCGGAFAVAPRAREMSRRRGHPAVDSSGRTRTSASNVAAPAFHATQHDFRGTPMTPIARWRMPPMDFSSAPLREEGPSGRTFVRCSPIHRVFTNRGRLKKG